MESKLAGGILLQIYRIKLLSNFTFRSVVQLNVLPLAKFLTASAAYAVLVINFFTLSFLVHFCHFFFHSVLREETTL